MSISPNPGLIDLLSDAGFRQWVKTGDYKKADNYWSDWRVKNADKDEIVRQAIHILLASHIDENITDADIDEIVEGTWERIHSQQKRVKRLSPQWWWAAASIGVVLAGIWLARNPETLNQEKAAIKIVARQDLEDFITQTNSDKKPMLIMLSDSSSVVLLPGSVLRYPAVFMADTREVQLTGEAFFEISKNPARPFFVHTLSITTKVVGTSFNVRAYENEPDVNVTVKTGKVSVYTNDEDWLSVQENAVLVLPDQHIIYDKVANKMYQPVIQSDDAQLALSKASFEFIDMPVTAILDSIAGMYDLQMDYTQADLSKCILTTSLTDVPLQGKLKIICTALGPAAHYSITESGIIITGRGCD